MRQLEDLANKIAGEYSSLPAAGADSITFHGIVKSIRPDDYKPIPCINQPALAAYVDGGNGVIFQTPMFTASINRVYHCMFRGKSRVKTYAEPGVQFLSLIRKTPKGLKFSIFGDGPYLPNPRDVEAASATIRNSMEFRLDTLARVFSEWRMAAHIAQRLGKGDMIIMDGSLSAWGSTEERLIRDVIQQARRRGVILCGLSKTTGLLMDSGRPLADYTNECGSKDPWYVHINEGTYMVKLHPASEFVYRLDIDDDYTHVERVVSSLMANSSDGHMPGYPYGLVDADRFAQVEESEVSTYGWQLRMLLPPKLRYSMDGYRQHDVLNTVS